MGVACGAIPLDGSTNVTLSILGKDEKIHHIPPKYIKDMYYEEVFEEKEILPEMILTSTDFTVEGTLFTLKPNYPYKVIYDGTSYSCISKTYVADSGTLVYLGYSFLLGGEKTGEPFGILSIGGTTLFGNRDANVTISIIEGGAHIHEIPTKYLPKIPIEKLPDSVVESGDEVEPIDALESGLLFTKGEFGEVNVSTEIRNKLALTIARNKLVLTKLKSTDGNSIGYPRVYFTTGFYATNEFYARSEIVYVSHNTRRIYEILSAEDDYGNVSLMLKYDDVPLS
jgi:hypothetical protein